MEFVSKYGIGDVLLIDADKDSGVTAVVRTVTFKECYGSIETYYEVQNGNWNVVVGDDGYDSAYRIIGKVGSVKEIVG